MMRVKLFPESGDTPVAEVEVPNTVLESFPDPNVVFYQGRVFLLVLGGYGPDSFVETTKVYTVPDNADARA